MDNYPLPIKINISTSFATSLPSLKETLIGEIPITDHHSQNSHYSRATTPAIHSMKILSPHVFAA